VECGLVEAFVAGLPAPAAPRLARDEALSKRLRASVREVTRLWGDLGVSPERFAGFLASRCAAADSDPLVALEHLHAADLYLACACCARSATAIAILERDHLQQLPRALARLSLSSTMVQETLQEVRGQLFVPSKAGRVSALERYLGRAPLDAWLRAVALRTAMRLLRARAKEVPVEESFLEDQLAGGRDAELTFLRTAYRPVFRSAFAAALAALETRQRNLLRQHYIDGVKVERLALMYGVHRVTLSRWLSAARGDMARAVERELMQSLGLRHSECASVVRLCMSRPELNFGSFITDASEP